MYISIEVLLVLLFTHWFFDFLCQSKWMANNKSESWKALLTHTGLYSVGTMLTVFLYNLTFLNMGTLELILTSLSFGSITFFIHTITDGISSTYTRKAFRKERYRKFFNIIGFDQFTHIVQIVLTYNLIS